MVDDRAGTGVVSGGTTRGEEASSSEKGGEPNEGGEPDGDRLGTNFQANLHGPTNPGLAVECIRLWDPEHLKAPKLCSKCLSGSQEASILVGQYKATVGQERCLAILHHFGYLKAAKVLAKLKKMPEPKIKLMQDMPAKARLQARESAAVPRGGAVQHAAVPVTSGDGRDNEVEQMARPFSPGEVNTFSSGMLEAATHFTRSDDIFSEIKDLLPGRQRFKLIEYFFTEWVNTEEFTEYQRKQRGSIQKYEAMCKLCLKPARVELKTCAAFACKTGGFHVKCGKFKVEAPEEGSEEENDIQPKKGKGKKHRRPEVKRWFCSEECRTRTA